MKTSHLFAMFFVFVSLIIISRLASFSESVARAAAAKASLSPAMNDTSSGFKSPASTFAETVSESFIDIRDNFPDFGAISDTITETIPEFVSNFFPSISDTSICNDTAWCNIDMPAKSYFRFSPPVDKVRWRRAVLQAARGEQVLLQRLVQVFPNFMDFLDGDTQFRSYHKIVDFFVGENMDLSPLKSFKVLPEREIAKLHPWEKSGSRVLPAPTAYKQFTRAPVVKIGYFAFKTDGSHWFDGPSVGIDAAGLSRFIQHYQAIKEDIAVPFIPFHSSNENWGMISTFYPNRTENWGHCCSPKDTAALIDIMDNEKTLMLLVNQHTNISHRKLLVVPRGMPIFNENNKMLLWDTMRMLAKKNMKSNMVFTATSNFGYRPQIMKCVADKFPPNDFFGQNHVDSTMKGRMGVEEYYKRLGSARFGLAMPGLGYDTFR
jgi:hypothetical protein